MEMKDPDKKMNDVDETAEVSKFKQFLDRTIDTSKSNHIIQIVTYTSDL